MPILSGKVELKPFELASFELELCLELEPYVELEFCLELKPKVFNG